MNGKECLLAFADVDNAYLTAESDIETIRRSFLQQKKRRKGLIGAVCGCIIVVFAVAAFGIGTLVPADACRDTVRNGDRRPHDDARSFL